MIDPNVWADIWVRQTKNKEGQSCATIRMSLWTDPQIVNHRIDEPGAISFYTSQGNLLKRNYTKIERREISQKRIERENQKNVERK